MSQSLVEFRSPAQLCYDLVCLPVSIPWVTAFQYVPENTYVCVLTEVLGEQTNGLYVKNENGIWVYGLSYADTCKYLVDGSTVKVVVDSVTEQTTLPDTILFINGFRLPSGSSITQNKNGVWVWVTAVGGGAGTANVYDLQGNLLGVFVTA